MAFGPNGAVISEDGDTSGSAPAKPEKIKRVGIAVFACGLVASVAVSLIAVAALFAANIIAHAFSLGGLDGLMSQNQSGFLLGLGVALIGSALNWWVFYLTVPAAWIALGFSIGRFPKRGIVASAPYRRWGAILGAILVALVTAPAGALFGGMNEMWLNGVEAFIGGLVGGGAVGALAGVICANLFLLIVRPERQLKTIDADVFS